MSSQRRRIARDARQVVRDGAEATPQRQRSRLADQVAYARAHSPYYRELYRDLPERVEDPTALPVVDKTTMMEHFDAWVTDRRVTRERVEEFVADPERVGERFQGKYLVATTSGTSGRRGLFLVDERTEEVITGLRSRPASDSVPGMCSASSHAAGAPQSSPQQKVTSMVLPARLG